jgi:hypothetical protein
MRTLSIVRGFGNPLGANSVENDLPNKRSNDLFEPVVGERVRGR